MEGDWYWGPDIQALLAQQAAANAATTTTLPTLATASSLSGMLPAQIQAQIEAAITTPAAAFNPESWLTGKKDAAGRISSADWTTGIRGLTGDERETLREYMFPSGIGLDTLQGYTPGSNPIADEVYKGATDLSMGYTVPNLGESGLGPDFLPGMNYASPLYPQSEMDAIIQAAMTRDSGGSDFFDSGFGTILTGGLSDVMKGNIPGAALANNPQAGLVASILSGGASDAMAAITRGRDEGIYAGLDRAIDPGGSVDAVTRKIGEQLPDEIRAKAPAIGSIVGNVVYPVFGAAAGGGIGAKIAGQDYGDSFKTALAAMLASYVAEGVSGLSAGDLSSAGEMVAQTADSGRYAISPEQWDILYGGSPFTEGTLASQGYTGATDLYAKMLSGAKLTPDEIAWINGPGYVSPETAASLDAAQQATSQAQRELPYKEPTPYDQVPETPTQLTPEQRGLLPASEAGGDVDQGWSTTGVPEAEQGPYVGPGPGAVTEGAWYENINWKDVIKGLQLLLNIYTAGGETEPELPEQFYSWFGGGGMALNDSMMMGTKNTKDTKLSNLEAGKLGGVEFPFDPRLLQYMNQYQTNYVGG